MQYRKNTANSSPLLQENYLNVSTQKDNVYPMQFKKMELNKNKLAMIILIFVFLSILGNLFVWLKITGNLAIGRASSGRVNICIDRPPVMQSILDQNATAENNFTYQVIATDSTNPIYYYGIASTTTGGQTPLTSFDIGHTTGLINFTPSRNELGNYSIYLWATHDICGNVSNDSKTFILTVSYTNQIPYWINYTRNFNLTEDILFTLNLSTFVTEPDNETFTMAHNSTAQTFPSFVMDSGGLINFTANDSDIGLHKINISVTDVRDGVNSSIFNFTVINVNDAPLLQSIPDQEACEDIVFSYQVNASDEDLLIPPAYRTEVLHYYDNTSLFIINEDTGLISFRPNYFQEGLHNIRIYVSDGEAADYKDMSLDIIETNDAPVLQHIGAKTIYVNQSLNYSAYASDEEDGDSPSTLRFNLTFLSGTQFFNINSITGLINFTTNNSVIGTYSVMIWVNDTALSDPHVNASSKCNDGSSKSDYEIVSFTVSDVNHAPDITYFNPTDRNLTIYELQNITFSVGAYDPDGTITTIEWYKNSSLTRTNNSLNDTYVFTTDYTSAGVYNITVNASDGELSDSLTWNVTVINVAPPVTPPTGGGGGGGGGICVEKWMCGDWSVCQNASLPQSILVLGSFYEKIMLNCSMQGTEAGKCGFRMRSCFDTAGCGTSLRKPVEIGACIFTLLPSCYDGILNCHDGLCEVLTDCGGPCKDCPTCSDGIQNQGEEWIDCGGPCPACPLIYPKPPQCGDDSCDIRELFTCKRDCSLFYITTIITFILVAFLIIIVRKEILPARRKVKEKELRKKKTYLYNLIASTKKAIADKSLTLARHYYNQASTIYDILPVNEKPKFYRRILKLFSEIEKLR